MAEDLGNPRNPSINNASVNIQVRRNSNPPVFQNTPYRSNITRTATNGQFLSGMSILVTDADNIVRDHNLNIMICYIQSYLLDMELIL